MTCHFCQRNTKEIDLKDTESLNNYTDSLCKIKSRKKTGLCARHQKRVARAIKRARQLGLLPYKQE